MSSSLTINLIYYLFDSFIMRSDMCNVHRIHNACQVYYNSFVIKCYKMLYTL